MRSILAAAVITILAGCTDPKDSLPPRDRAIIAVWESNGFILREHRGTTLVFQKAEPDGTVSLHYVSRRTMAEYHTETLSTERSK
jgi:hypothetical protein